MANHTLNLQKAKLLVHIFWKQLTVEGPGALLVIAAFQNHCSLIKKKKWERVELCFALQTVKILKHY